MLVTLLALGSNWASAANYAVPSAYPTVGAAVTASQADPAAVVLISTSYDPIGEPVVSLAGWSGAIRSATPGALAPSPALHDVDGVVAIQDLRVGLAPGMYATSFGVVVTGSLTADHVVVPGLLEPGASVGLASSGMATLDLTRVEVYGQTGGAIVADGGAVTLTNSDVHDNILASLNLPLWSLAAGLSLGDDTVATVTGTHFGANQDLGGDRVSCIAAMGGAALTVRASVFQASQGSPIAGFGAADVTVETSTFDGTSLGDAGAVVTYSVPTVSISSVAVTNASGGVAGALVINAVPMELWMP